MVHLWLGGNSTFAITHYYLWFPIRQYLLLLIIADYYLVLPWHFKKEILSKLENNENIIISAHGNSLRAVCKYLFDLNENQITKLEIPTGNPLFINFNDKLEITQCYYLDKERAKNLIAF